MKKVLLSAVAGGLIAFTFTGCYDNSKYQNDEQASEVQNVNVTIDGKLFASAKINKNYSVKDYKDYIVAFSGLDSLIIGYLSDDFANGDNEYLKKKINTIGDDLGYATLIEYSENEVDGTGSYQGIYSNDRLGGYMTAVYVPVIKGTMYVQIHSYNTEIDAVKKSNDSIISSIKIADEFKK